MSAKKTDSAAMLKLVDKAFIGKDASKEHGMKIADHKLIVQVLDTHLKVMNEDLDERLTKRDKEISEAIGKDVADYLRIQWADICRTLDTQTMALKMQTELVMRVLEDITTLKSKVKQGEEDISALKKIAQLPETFDERLANVEALIPIIHDAKKYMSPKWSVVRWSIIIIIGTLLVLYLGARFPEMIHRIFSK